MALRVVSWNMRQAGASSNAWEYLLELGPDIALLQEVTAIPDGIADRFSVIEHRASWRDGKPQRFSTAVLAAPGACATDALRNDTKWVNDELARFAGNLVSTRVHVGATELRVVSVHSPAWPIPRDRLVGIDTSAVKLTQNPDVWLADILWTTLPPSASDAWIVGGDFNLSETFDAWKGGPRDNREYLDRMTNSGYTECLRAATGRLTHRHSDDPTDRCEPRSTTCSHRPSSRKTCATVRSVQGSVSSTAG